MMSHFHVLTLHELKAWLDWSGNPEFVQLHHDWASGEVKWTNNEITTGRRFTTTLCYHDSSATKTCCDFKHLQRSAITYIVIYYLFSTVNIPHMILFNKIKLSFPSPSSLPRSIFSLLIFFYINDSCQMKCLFVQQILFKAVLHTD